MYSTTARQAAARVGQARVSVSSPFSEAKKLSATALSSFVNYARSRCCAANCPGDSPVPPVVGAGVRVRGGPPDLGRGPGVLPRRRGQAAFASGGLDGCGRAGRVRDGGGWPVPVPGGGPAGAGAAGGELPAGVPVTGV